ncbi:MAG: hypothetical protein A2175_00025 [Candidatus Nealsonbacteria bacterium RBG_13_42_11]|uniref:Uncharacterized protein n=1 Tax=Candidatus Nealsonbacteria bacterium RBG_13_42_11 TaxID=1801663 RepID=A0A1G2E011_9BACT|nr:MAG: hypothetical protein A2175_00025 [Candidatus Nealsonbacteria bacterium RBG_13_42_11]
MILAIGAGVSVIVLQETKMVKQVGNSVISFYAADSGIEMQLFDLYKKESHESGYENVSLSNDSVYSVTAECSKYNIGERCVLTPNPDSSCDAPNYCLNSIGTYEKTKRAIEIKY